MMRKIIITALRTLIPKGLSGLLKPALLMLVLVVMGGYHANGQIEVEIFNSVSNSTIIQNNTFSYTVPAGINNNNHQMLMVMISSGERGITTITYRGIPLELVVNNEISRARTYIYRLLAPAAGSGDLVVNFDGGNGRGAVVGIMTLGNVNTANATPTFSATGGETSTNNISHSVTSVAGQRVFNVVASQNNQLLLAGAGQTELWKTSVGSEPNWAGASHITATGASTTMTWARTTANTNDWSIALVAVNPACVLGTVSLTQPTCINGSANTGAITISSPVGGSGPYQYRLGTNDWQSGNVFSGLAAGSYTVSIRDANNTSCEVNLGTYSLVYNPVVVDNTTSQVFNTGQSNLTMNHLVSSNNNRLMLVGISIRDRLILGTLTQGEETINVTFAEEPLIYHGRAVSNGTDADTYIFYLLNPPSGSGTLSLNFASALGTSASAVVGISTFSNVNQNSPIGPFISSIGESSSPSLSITATATNQMVFQVLAAEDASATVTPTSGQDQRWLESTTNSPTGGGYTRLGNATNTLFEYSLGASQRWSVSGVAINPAPVADLAITKSVSDANPFVGEEITFTVIASNPGCSDAPLVEVFDPIPSGFTYVSHTANKGAYLAGTGNWEIGTLDVDETATLTITVVVRASGSYSNTASISSPVIFDPGGGNNSATASIVPCPAGGTAPLFSGNKP